MEELLIKTVNFVSSTQEGRAVIESPIGSLTLTLTKIQNEKVLGFNMISLKKRYRGKGIGSAIIKETVNWVDTKLIGARVSLNVMSPIANKILEKYDMKKINKFADIIISYPSYVYTKNEEILRELCD